MKASLLQPLMTLAAMAIVSKAAFVPKARLNRFSKNALCRGFSAVLTDVKPEPPPSVTPSQATLPEVFKGVHLPPGEEPPIISNEFTRRQVGKYQGEAPKIFSLLGAPKTSLSLAQLILQEINGLTSSVPSENYNFFGTGDFARELTLFLKSNPFWASALTETPDGFELKAFDPEEEDPSLFLKMMRTLNGVGHRVNFKFDKQMEIQSFTVFDDLVGEPIECCEADLQKYASSALYNVFFYSSCVHATIHVLQYLMTAGFQYASSDFEAMNQWAVTYAKNIPIKYEQVGQLLINDPPIPEPPFAPRLDTALITGVDGFGSSQAIRPILKELLDMWGQSPTAEGWFSNMVKLSPCRMEEAGILTEFMKHFKLVKPFAKDAACALREIDPNKFAGAEMAMKDYLKRCGDFKSNINSMEDWLELISVTGIVHGGTLSYTRLLGIPEVARWRNYQTKTWDFADLNLVTGGLGTIVGMEKGRHVMSSTTDKYNDKLQAVLDKYDEKATCLKEEFENTLVDNPDFDDYGFILSDYCRDDFDGKQLTIGTYI